MKFEQLFDKYLKTELEYDKIKAEHLFCLSFCFGDEDGGRRGRTYQGSEDS